eukprot:447016-Rhodomonas_salina.1
MPALNATGRTLNFPTWVPRLALKFDLPSFLILSVYQPIYSCLPTCLLACLPACLPAYLAATSHLKCEPLAT